MIGGLVDEFVWFLLEVFRPARKRCCNLLDCLHDLIRGLCRPRIVLRECLHVALRINKLQAVKQPLTKRARRDRFKPCLLALPVWHVLPQGETHRNFHAEELRNPLRAGIELRNESVLFRLVLRLLLCYRYACSPCLLPLFHTHLELSNLHLLGKRCILDGKDGVTVLELLQLAAGNLANIANLSLTKLHHGLLYAKLCLLHVEVTSRLSSIHHHCRLVLLEQGLSRGDVIRSGRSLSIQRVVRAHNLRKFKLPQNVADRVL